VPLCTGLGGNELNLGPSYKECMKVKHTFFDVDNQRTDSDDASLRPYSDPTGLGPAKLSEQRRRQHEIAAKQRSPTEERTTVMIQNIPSGYDRSMFVMLLEEQGFCGHFDFVYLAYNLKTRRLHGYALVNLESPLMAQVFKDWFNGFRDWGDEGGEMASTAWGDQQHGKAEHIERYRNSPLMHASVDDEHKPMVFRNGVQHNFPPPSKELQAPQRRRRIRPDRG